MAVTEALMTLFLRERISAEEVAQAAQRIEKETRRREEEEVDEDGEKGKEEDQDVSAPVASLDQECALLRWAGACCRAMEGKARREMRKRQNQVRINARYQIHQCDNDRSNNNNSSSSSFPTFGVSKQSTN